MGTVESGALPPPLKAIKTEGGGKPPLSEGLRTGQIVNSISRPSDISAMENPLHVTHM